MTERKDWIFQEEQDKERGGRTAQWPHQGPPNLQQYLLNTSQFCLSDFLFVKTREGAESLVRVNVVRTKAAQRKARPGTEEARGPRSAPLPRS